MFDLDFPVFAQCNAGDRIDFRQPFTQMIGVIATISDDRAVFGYIGLKALTRLCNIRPIARCQAQMDRATVAIADQMQLRASRDISYRNALPGSELARLWFCQCCARRRCFFTPLAAIRWVLT